MGKGPHTIGTELLSQTLALPTVVSLPVTDTFHAPLRHAPPTAHWPPTSMVPAWHSRHDPGSGDEPQSTQPKSSQPTVKFHVSEGVELPSADSASTRQR